MKFDIVRAWKNETYRQSLNKKQRDRLPANPAGELTEAEMERVIGGDGSGGGMQPATPVVTHHARYHHRSATVATAAAASSRSCVHSYSILCDVNVFSLDVDVLAITHLLDIGASEKQVCINGC